MEFADFDATGQAQLVAAGQASPAELIGAAIERIERLDPELNAVIHPRFERALEEAKGLLPDGPFRGVPLVVKDLWPSMAGEPHYMGSQLLKDVDRRPNFDSNIVQRYRDGGFIVVGRTNTPEQGASATTEPRSYGPTRNPWNTDFSPGGSSGGSAAAVASGMVPAANASDGGGSIRIPSSACGLVGLKPSRGRISMGPADDEWGLSVQHAVTTSVRDSAAMLDLCAGPFPGDGVVAPAPLRAYVEELVEPGPRLRVGIMTELDGVEVDDECLRAATIAADALVAAGHEVSVAQPGAMAMLPEISRHGAALFTSGTAHRMDAFAEEFGVDLGPRHMEPTTWMMVEMGRQMTATALVEAASAHQRFRREMAKWWAGGFDLLLTPTTAAVTPALGELACSDENPLDALFKAAPYTAFVSMFNITGQPAISLPVHVTAEGLPVGAQLVAAYGREDLLVSAGADLERVLDWGSRRPQLHAASQ